MHRSLLVPEIAQHICNAIDGRYEPENAERNALLFSMAQTCRIFREPALASLWEAIPSLVPIIQCAGANIWTASHTSSGIELRLTRSLYRTDIRTMKKYAALVRHFGPQSNFRPVVSHHPVYVDQRVWRELQRALRNATLFENLQSIYVDEDIQPLKHKRLFSTENLTALSISADPPQSSMLVDFAIQCPRLKSLELGWEGAIQPGIFKSMTSALPKWSNLSIVYLSHVTSGVLQSLSHHSRSLRSLAFNHLVPSGNALQTSLPPRGNNTPTYPVLEVMNVGFLGIADAIRFLEYLPVIGSLRQFEVDIQNQVPSQEKDWLDMLGLVKKGMPSLTKLAIYEGRLCYYGNAPSLSNALIPVLATGSAMLTRVDIKNTGGYNIVDGDLGHLTQALPLVEYFNMGEHFTPPLYRTTIACLLHFARNCRFLYYLGIGFDARADKVPRGSGSSIQAPNLIRLAVFASPMDNPQIVTDFLLSIFPNLHGVFSPRITTHGGEDGSEDENEGGVQGQEEVENGPAADRRDHRVGLWSEISDILAQRVHEMHVQ